MDTSGLNKSLPSVESPPHRRHTDAGVCFANGFLKTTSTVDSFFSVPRLNCCTPSTRSVGFMNSFDLFKAVEPLIFLIILVSGAYIEGTGWHNARLSLQS